MKTSMRGFLSASRLKNPNGFSLIEIIFAIVLVGIIVPSVVVPFSGIKDLAAPQKTSEATYLAMAQMEAISEESFATVPDPPLADSSCATFQATVTKIDCNLNSEYTFTFDMIYVDADDLDTDAGGTAFGKKLTMTITHNDGSMDPLDFYALY